MAELQIVPVAIGKNVEAQYVEMRVPLYSYGCEKKIKKALANLRGIYSVDVNFNEQKVTVWGICNKYDVLDTIRSKRKGAHFWNITPQDNEEDDLVTGSQEQSSIDATMPSSSSSGTSVFRRNGKGIVPLPPLTLIKCRSSLSWKAWKKVFIRSYSF